VFPQIFLLHKVVRDAKKVEKHWYKLAKKTKTPRKTQKNSNQLKTKRIINVKISAEGAQFPHSAFQGGG